MPPERGRLTCSRARRCWLSWRTWLAREKFASRLRQASVTPRELVLGYAALARLVEPATIEPVIQADLDDDSVLSCAVAAKANFIVSGDSHLLGLAEYQGIPILRAAQLLTQIQT